jgi:hypothetical protein
MPSGQILFQFGTGRHYEIFIVILSLLVHAYAKWSNTISQFGIGTLGVPACIGNLPLQNMVLMNNEKLIMNNYGTIVNLNY